MQNELQYEKAKYIVGQKFSLSIRNVKFNYFLMGDKRNMFEQVFESLNKDAEELVKLLVASIKTSKSNNKILHSQL